MSNEVRRYYYVYRPPKTEGGGGVSKEYVDRQVAGVLAHANGLEGTIKTAVKTEIDNELAVTIPTTVSAKFLEKKGEILQEIGDNHFLYEDIGNLNKNAVIALYPNENYCTFSSQEEPRTVSSLTGFNLDGVLKLHDNNYFTTTGSIKKDLKYADLSTIEFSVFLVAEINLNNSVYNELFSIYKSTGVSNERISFFLPWGTDKCMIDPFHVDHRKTINIPNVIKYANKPAIIHISFKSGKLNFWINDDIITQDMAINLGTKTIPNTGDAKLTIDAFKLRKLYGFYFYKDGSVDVKKVLMKRYLQDMEFVGRRLIGVSDPVKNKDAVNKEYMESHTTTVGGAYMLKSAPDAGGNKIINVGDPTEATDAVNKEYMESHTTTVGGAYMLKSAPDAGGNKISNVGDPTEATDAVNKQYMESHATTVAGDYMLKSAPDASGNPIRNVANPTLIADAANKRYVDEKVVGSVAPIDLDRDSIPVADIDIYPHPSKATGTTPVTAIDGGFSTSGTVNLVINTPDNRVCFHNYHYDVTPSANTFIYKSLPAATFNTDQFTYFLIFNPTYTNASPYTMFIQDPNDSAIRISVHWVWSDDNIYIDCFNVAGGRITIREIEIRDFIRDRAKTIVLGVHVVSGGAAQVFVNGVKIKDANITANFNPVPNALGFKLKDADRIYGFYFYKTALSREMLNHLNEYFTNRYNTDSLIVNRKLRFISEPVYSTDGVNMQYVDDLLTSYAVSLHDPDVDHARIKNVGAPVETTDGANKNYVDSIVRGYAVSLQDPDVEHARIRNVGDPTDPKDAVNKQYFETHGTNVDDYDYKTLKYIGIAGNGSDASNAIGLGNSCFRVINSNSFDKYHRILPGLQKSLKFPTPTATSGQRKTVTRFGQELEFFTILEELTILDLPRSTSGANNNIFCTVSFLNYSVSGMTTPPSISIELVEDVTNKTFTVNYEFLVNGLYDARVTNLLGVGGTTIDVNPFDNPKFMHVIGIEKTLTTFNISLNGTQYLLNDLINEFGGKKFGSMKIRAINTIHIKDISFYATVGSDIGTLTSETLNYWDNLGKPLEIRDTNMDTYINEPFSDGNQAEDKSRYLDIQNNAPAVANTISLVVSFTPRNRSTLDYEELSYDHYLFIKLNLQKEDGTTENFELEATRNYISTKENNISNYIYGPQLGARSMKLNFLAIKIYFTDDLKLGLEFIGNNVLKLNHVTSYKLKNNILTSNNSLIRVRDATLNYLSIGRTETNKARDLFIACIAARSQKYTDFFQLSSIYLSTQIFSSVTAVSEDVVNRRLPRFYIPKHIDRYNYIQYQIVGTVKPRGTFTNPPTKMLFYSNNYVDADGDRGNRILELDFASTELNGDLVYKSLEGFFIPKNMQYLSLWLWEVKTNLIVDIYLDFYVAHFTSI